MDNGSITAAQVTTRSNRPCSRKRWRTTLGMGNAVAMGGSSRKTAELHKSSACYSCPRGQYRMRGLTSGAQSCRQLLLRNLAAMVLERSTCCFSSAPVRAAIPALLWTEWPAKIVRIVKPCRNVQRESGALAAILESRLLPPPPLVTLTRGSDAL